MKLPELFKLKKHRWVDSDGKRAKASAPGAIKKIDRSKDWYAYIPVIESAKQRNVRRQNGGKKAKRELVRLCQNKRAAQEMLQEIIEAAEKKAAGIIDYMAVTQQRIAELIIRYQNYLKSRGSGDEYVELTIARIESICGACKFVRIGDLNAEPVADWLYQQRQDEIHDIVNVRGTAKSYREIAEKFGVKERTVTYWRQQGAPIVPRGKTNLAELSKWYNVWRSRSMGVSTSNHYVTAMKGFGRWLEKKARVIKENPLEDLEKADARTDVRKSRRILESNEFATLIQAARESKRWFRGLNGDDRAVIYILAAYTGLRAGEIASLQQHSFDFKASPAVVKVAPAYTKNSEPACIPLRKDLVEVLGGYLADREVGSGVIWPGSWSEDGAKMIRIDLAGAGIEYTDANGDDFDFHALRHQFISDLAKAGVPLRVAQELARHSKPELTANIYTHLSAKDTVAEVEKLASVPSGLPATEEVLPEGDFGPPPGPPTFTFPAHLGHQTVIFGNSFANEKSPEFTGKTGLFVSDADGTRTRNLRIDSPGL